MPKVRQLGLWQIDIVTINVFSFKCICETGILKRNVQFSLPTFWKNVFLNRVRIGKLSDSVLELV